MTRLVALAARTAADSEALKHDRTGTRVGRVAPIAWIGQEAEVGALRVVRARRPT